jgi:lactoylglutathione lyase
MEIDYIALFVADVARSIVFYRDLLGMEFPKPIKDGGTEGLSGKLKLGIYDRAWLPKLLGEQLKTDRNQPMFLLSMSIVDLEAFYQMLIANEVDVVGPPQLMPWGQRIVFFKDPDGNLLEAVQTNPERVNG